MTSTNFYDDSRYVKELTASDLKKDDLTFVSSKNTQKCHAVLFYCSWCPHCQAIKDSWEGFAKKASFIDVYSFNCVSEENDAFLNEVRKNSNIIGGYPTIVYYKDNKVSGIFDGDRTSGGFLEYGMKVCRS